MVSTCRLACIPQITNEFHALNEIGWYGSAYLLTTCAFQPIFGRLYSHCSAKWTYVSATLWFTIGSVISASAPSSSFLVVGRAVSGVGAAGLLSGAFIIIAMLTTPAKTPIFQGIISAMFGLSSVSAPLIGGLFTDLITWRLCFYILVPIGFLAICLLLVCLDLPPARSSWATTYQAIQELDVGGTALFLTAFTCLLFALQYGGIWYSWADWHSAGLLAISGMLTIIWLCDQVWMGENAMIPLRMIRHPVVAAVGFFILCIFGQFTVSMYFIPIYFQAVKGDRAEEAAINILPLVAAAVVLSLLVGILVSRLALSTPFLFCACSILSALGSGLFLTLNTDTANHFTLVFQLVQGVGTGLALQLPPVAVQSVLPRQDVPIGVATILAMEFLGASVFVSVANNLFNQKLLKYVEARRIPGLISSQLVEGGVTSVYDLVSADDKPKIRQAYAGAIHWPFGVAVALACISVIGAAGYGWKSVGNTATGVLPPDESSALDESFRKEIDI